MRKQILRLEDVEIEDRATWRQRIKFNNFDKPAAAPRRLVEKTLELLLKEEPEGVLDLSYYAETPEGGVWHGKRLRLVEVELHGDWSKWGLEPPPLIYRFDDQRRLANGQWGYWTPIEEYRPTPERLIAWEWERAPGFWRVETARQLWMTQLGLSQSELGEVVVF